MRIIQQMIRQNGKRSLATLLALVMCLSLLPSVVWAEPDSADGQSPPGQAEEVATTEANTTELSDDVQEWKKITTTDEFTSGGQFIIAAEYNGQVYALGMTVDTDKFIAEPLTLDNDLPKDDTLPIWKVEPTSTEDSVYITDGNKKIAYSSGTNINLSNATDTEKKQEWNIKVEDNGFLITSVNSKTRYLAFQHRDNKDSVFGAYAESNKTGATYSFYLIIFKLNGSSSQPSEPETKVKEPTADPSSGSIVYVGDKITLSCGTPDAKFKYNTESINAEDENWIDVEANTITIKEDGEKTYYVKAVKEGLEDSEVLPVTYIIKPNVLQEISEAKDGDIGTQFRVKGVVTLADGKNIYIQDSTGGICAFFSSSLDIDLGDTIIVRGKKTEYNGLPELENAMLEEKVTDTANKIELSAKATAFKDITSDIICEYIKATDLVIKSISGEKITVYANGSPDEVKIIYKPKNKNLAVGDIITIQAAVGIFNSDIQLRTTNAEEITVTTPGEVSPPTAEPAAGSQIASGTEVKLSSKTAVVDFESSSTPDGDTWIKVTDGKLAVTGEVGETQTVYVRAVRTVNGKKLTSAVVTLTYTIKDSTEPAPPVESLYKPEQGDKVVIFYPNGKKVMTGKLSGTRLVGEDATISGSQLYTKADALVLTVNVEGTGSKAVYTFTAEDGRILSTKNIGGSLTLENADSGQVGQWLIKETDGGYLIKSTTAISNSKMQYIEFYSGNFTTYGYDGSTNFVMKFYPADSLGKALSTDDELEDTIAQWGGGMDNDKTFDNAKAIPGDLYKVGDNLDESSTFVVSRDGSAISPYTGGNGNKYVGAYGIGTKTTDFLELKTSTFGYGNIGLSFRMRFSGSSPSDFQLQYSTDNINYNNVETGNASYSSPKYSADGTSEGSINVDKPTTEGKVEGLKDSTYINYTFTLPVGAQNAETLYIRFVPNTGKTVSGKTEIGSSNNVRIDSIKITGNPINEDIFPGYVTAEPDGLDEDVPAGTSIIFTPSVSGAAVTYRFVKMDGTLVNEWSPGTSGTLPTTLPVALELKATKDGKDGPVRRYIYQAGTVESVKMNPNGGGIVFTNSDEATIKLSCATSGATIMYRESRMKAVEGEIPYKEYKDPITVNKGFGSLTVDAYAIKEGLADSAKVSRTFTEREKEKYNLFFGQMHSHTGFSDGTETPDAAYAYADGLEDVWNMDFLSVTDHSNSLDGAGGTKSINDEPADGEWQKGKTAAEEATNSDFVGIFGYEMTWSNGLGHINTFNTTGFQDRTQSAYTSYSTALPNYYAELKTAPASISQFNHPGTTFGDFSDFAHYDPEIDDLITLIEVGNGEGAIGSAGYFPSYEYYTRALDKGWHVAPTNNQDNHKGKWGDANTGRDVVLVDELTETAIYDAMRNYRVYATEDLNFEVYYTFDGNIMGTQLTSSDVGETAVIKVELNDPDPQDHQKATVQVIANGGKEVAKAESTLDHDTVTITVPTTYNYYYIKITQNDKDIAVTAPVWVGAVEAIGVSSFSAQDALTIAGKAQAFDLSLYNNEKKSADITSIVITDKNSGEVITTIKDITKVRKMGTAETTFTHIFKADGIYTLRATVNGILNGKEKTWTQDLEITVMPAEIVTKILIDGTHYNDYVTGYYGGNMGNMTTIASNNAVQVTIVGPGKEITSDMLKDCSLLVLSAPAKKSDTANTGSYEPSVYTDEFISMIKQYVENGGNIVVAGLADYQDRSGDYHSSVQQNNLLSGIGSTMSINDDEAYDLTNNGGQAYRLYPATFNMSSEWTKGILTKEVAGEGNSFQEYSQYSGCTVNPGKGTWLVKGFDTTFSVDSDKDGRGALDESIKVETGKDDNGSPKYTTYNYVVKEGQAYFLAHEKVGKGNVFASGGVFLSDFEVKAELDNIWDLPYANRTIYENILNTLCLSDNVTPIADTRKADLGRLFIIEGYVTNGTVAEQTTFYDAIYVQDETGGTTCFPYATTGLEIGTKVRILGYTDAYQGDREIQIISLSILDDDPKIYEPEMVTTMAAADYDKNGGNLLKTEGIVSNIQMAGTKVSQFDLTDGTGVKATIFIDGYIWNDKKEDNISNKLKEGQTVQAVGLAYLHPEGDLDVGVPVLRVRNMDEIEIVDKAEYYAITFKDQVTGKAFDSAKVKIGSAIGTFPTAPSHSGYNFSGWSCASVSSISKDTIPESDLVITAQYTVNSTGYGGGGSSSSGSGGSTTPSKDSIVTTGDVKDPASSTGGTTTETTAKPSATQNGTTASSTVDTFVGDEIVKQVEDNKSETAVVAPEFSKDTTKAEVSIPGETVDKLADRTDADVRVETPVADVTIPNEALSELGGSGNLVVATEKTDNGVKVEVRFNNSTVNSIPGGLTVEAPVTEVKPSTVAVLVKEDGTREVIPTSVADAETGTIKAVVDGTAHLEFIDNHKDFNDVSSGDWFSDVVDFASSHELMKGTGEKTFEPKTVTDRASMAQLLYNLEKNPEAGINDFIDAKEGAWYNDAIAWAASENIVNGYGDGRFGPSDPITREQLAVLLYNYAKEYKGMDTSSRKNLSTYADGSKVSSWASDALGWAVAEGLVNGVGGNSLNPGGQASRSEVAAIIMRFVQKMAR